MKAMRTFRYRIYPSKKQEKQLQMRLWECKEMWNGLLEYTKESRARTGKLPSRFSLIKLTKGKSSILHSQTAQNVADRLCKSIKGMIARKRKGLKAGFPRFKPVERIKSLTYPQSGFKLEEKLKLSKIGEIRIRKHRELKGTIKTLTIKRMPSGKWYAIFTSEVEVLPKTGTHNPKPRVGIDLGIEYFAYLSNGAVIQNPKHLRKEQLKLSRLQKSLSGKKKGSRNRVRAKLRVARAHERVANGRNDFLHKASRMLAGSYSLIAMEALNVAGMGRGFLAKSVHDCGWAEFSGMLRYKAEEAGCEVVLVNPARTTQTCSCCGLVRKKTLAQRRHSCACGASMHRDLNAAINILKRATAGTAGSNACGEGPSTHYEDNGARAFHEAGSPAL